MNVVIIFDFFLKNNTLIIVRGGWGQGKWVDIYTHIKVELEGGGGGTPHN